MSADKRCPHCDTTLEFESDGKHFRFTAHDDQFCTAATRDRVRVLTSALAQQQQTFLYHMEAAQRQFDRILAEHGLASLAERGREAAVRSLELALRMSPLVEVPKARGGG